MGGPRSKSRRGSGQARPPGELRIIGGAWRSRRIRFAAETGVRPTPDRVRETLFNWLTAIVPGARCLDLFAGSGALGFEALSRDAGQVTFVDQDIRVVQQLQANIDTLNAGNAEPVWSEAFAYLRETRAAPFDIVFVDPPFRDRVLEEGCLTLERSGLLAKTAWIYLEADRGDPDPVLPDNWQQTHRQTAGQVAYSLCRRTSGQDAAGARLERME